MSMTAKITAKGQVTIPKKIRTFLNSDIVEFKVINNKIILKSVNSVSGSLNKYAKKYVLFKGVRDSVWNEVVNEKFEK